MADRSCMLEVKLRPGRDRSLRRHHPWVLSGSVGEVTGGGSPQPGDWARVVSAEGQTLGFGDYAPDSSLRVRLFAFGEKEPRGDWLAERLIRAVARRRDDPLIANTDALRLVNAEGDGLPGLTVDRYADVAVVKLTTAGMDRRREQLSDLLREVTEAKVGFERADAVSARRDGFAAHQGALWGVAPSAPVAILEHERCFEVDCVAGQKTGFYLDQRDSRDLVALLASDRRVLDLFSYSGGFGVAAARAGARSVTFVDSSSAALDQARRHLAANAPQCAAEFLHGDAFAFIRGSGTDDWDLLVIDPPPLARRKGDVARASRAYKDVILAGLRRAAPGALLLAFACSHHIGPDLFRKIVFGAVCDAHREVQVLRTLGAPSDHPVSIDHPEGQYLTGLLLRL